MTPIRTYHELTEQDRSKLGSQVGEQRDRVRQRLEGVKHVVAVMSGKGGVGKSFVTASLATAMARRGRKVGVLDADLYGPTTARMLGIEGGPLTVTDQGVEPVVSDEEVRVISTDLILPEGAPLQWREPGHESFIWHGALEAGMLREFLSDVAWGELDLLLVDLPPGVERLNALRELVPNLAGVLVVTIPSDASRRAVERSIESARGVGLKVLGIVENMAGYQCSACGVVSPLFEGEAARELSDSTGVPVLASIPFQSEGQAAADHGHLKSTGKLAAQVRELADALLDRIEAPPP